MSNPCRIAALCSLFFTSAVITHAQMGPRIRVPAVKGPSNVQALSKGPGLAAEASPSNLVVTYIGASNIGLAWTAPATPSGSKFDHYEVQHCENTSHPNTDCIPYSITINNVPLKIATTSYLDTKLKHSSYYKYDVIAVYVDGSGELYESPPSAAMYAGTVRYSCLVLPVRYWCMNFGTGKDANINAFYQTSGPFTFFDQIKSIYNGASGSATVSADLGTLNFGNGMQLTVSTNVQAGSSAIAPVSSNKPPTLSSNAAAQGTQDMLFGGTFVLSQLYPLFAAGASKLTTAGGLGFSMDFMTKEGVDIQNFTSGSNVNVTNPPFHGSGQMEGFVQYNSINLVPNSNSSQSFVGSIFAGGSYGYSYTSPAYLKDYGFAGNQNNGIGQIVFGIVLNTVAKISVSRGFGPLQTYTNSATMATTRVNNFTNWSIGVTYQSPTPQSPASASKQ